MTPPADDAQEMDIPSVQDLVTATSIQAEDPALVLQTVLIRTAQSYISQMESPDDRPQATFFHLKPSEPPMMIIAAESLLDRPILETRLQNGIRQLKNRRQATSHVMTRMLTKELLERLKLVAQSPRPTFLLVSVFVPSENQWMASWVVFNQLETAYEALSKPSREPITTFASALAAQQIRGAFLPIDEADAFVVSLGSLVVLNNFHSLQESFTTEPAESPLTSS